MIFTEEEKMMYQVMAAMYKSALPISFKGSMVLKACLEEVGYYDQIRHTVDIDANWNSKELPTTQMMADGIQKAIDDNKLNLDISIYRQYGEGRSAGFEIRSKATKEILFTLDMDVNRPLPPTKLYEIEDIRFRGVSPIQMIADKVSVVSSDKIFRRIKDVVDLFYMSKVFEFDKKDVIKTLENYNRTLGSFDGFLNRTNDLKHAYELFRFEGGIDKPSFNEVYESVKKFITDILP